MEQEVVANYVQRMADARALGELDVDGNWVEIFLEGQIQKSREDIDEIKQLLKGV